METVQHIEVYTVLGSNLNTREAVYLLFPQQESFRNAVIELDLDRVEFMSRSFADEFHKLREKVYQENATDIQVFNASEDVLEMLRIVASTQHQAPRRKQHIVGGQFLNPKELEAFLLTL